MVVLPPFFLLLFSFSSQIIELSQAAYRFVQEGGIEPDIIVPQLSDPDYKSRPRFREADLSRHLINEAKVDNSVLEADDKSDPRFSATAEELKAKGINDFQLDYAVKTVSRLSKTQVAATGSGRKGSR